jgi:uncharacterized membrane protein
MDAPLELIVSVYQDERTADQVLRELRRGARDDGLEVIDGAVIVKDERGKVRMHDTEDVGPGRGALFGAITGGLIGLLAGPAGAVAGALAGAATGGATAAIVDMGFTNDQLEELRASMPPGSSAMVALIEHKWVEKLVRELEDRRGKLFRHEVSQDLADQYKR